MKRQRTRTKSKKRAKFEDCDINDDDDAEPNLHERQSVVVNKRPSTPKVSPRKVGTIKDLCDSSDSSERRAKILEEDFGQTERLKYKIGLDYDSDSDGKKSKNVSKSHRIHNSNKKLKSVKSGISMSKKDQSLIPE